MQELFPGLDHGASAATAAWSDREVANYCVLHHADTAWRGLDGLVLVCQQLHDERRSRKDGRMLRLRWSTFAQIRVYDFEARVSLCCSIK